ncbi:hypothetical protein C8Q76DRAFT_855661 [Earliella scabrosa]|nr:hypothetical protein C8Q76DRAFT_855661 [Earliella scabrosa]
MHEPENLNCGDHVGRLPSDPTAALQWATQTIDVVNHIIKELFAPGESYRKETLFKDLENMRTEISSPRTVIAICGATGAGKSSLINALLEDTIVTTSGIAACTSVITEIVHSDASTYEANVEYLTLVEWDEELGVLLADLRDTADGCSPLSDQYEELSDEARAALDKIHAVYPWLDHKALAAITTEQLLRSSPDVTRLLGSVVNVVVDSASDLAAELSQYVEDPSCRSTSRDARDAPAVAHWPLIGKVTIRCPSPLLATGAVLVDLPGTADSNAARCKMAKDYIRRASRLFIVSPVARAVSDKVARDMLGEAFKIQLKLDGKYNPDTITFIASKCDDISCQEIIGNLRLGGDIKLREIEDAIKGAEASRAGWMATIEQKLKPLLAQLESRLRKLKTRLRVSNQHRATKVTKDATSTRPFVSGSTASKPRSATVASAGSHKRTRETSAPASSDSDVDNEPCKKREDNSIQHELQMLQDQIKSERSTLSLALEGLNIAEKRLQEVTALRTKFCAARRSEWAAKRIQADFKIGLEDLDDCQDDICQDCKVPLPVFSCSSRDYLRLIGKAPGDGKPACFTDIDDTGIPAIRKRVHELTFPVREEAARKQLARLRAFVKTVCNCIQGSCDVNDPEIEALREVWLSLDRTLKAANGGLESNREARNAHYGSHPTSLVARLVSDSQRVVDNVMLDIDMRLMFVLRQEFHEAAKLAASSALTISDAFAAGRMRWNTYRAVLRRNGAFKNMDLNADLSTPFTRRLIGSWSQTYTSAHLVSIDGTMLAIATDLLSELTGSVPDRHRARATALVEDALCAARVELGAMAGVAQETLDEHQQRLSRSIAVFVETELTEGYQQAVTVRGRGSFRQQKSMVHDLIRVKKDAMFREAAYALGDNLTAAVKAVGGALDDALEQVAKKIEVEMSALWEPPLQRVDDEAAFTVAKARLEDIIQDIDRWTSEVEERGSVVQETPKHTGGKDEDASKTGAVDVEMSDPHLESTACQQLLAPGPVTQSRSPSLEYVSV